MLKKETTSKNTFSVVMGVIVITAVCFFVCQYRTNADSSNEALVSVENGAIGQAGNEMLQLLLKLKSLSLDENIFEDEAFQNLKDFSLKLQEQPVGRNNPFAPVKSGEEYIFDRTSTSTDPSM